MRFFKSVAIAVMVAWAGVSAAQEKQDWADLAHYAENNKVVSQLPASERRVVFFGNSITELWTKFHPNFFASHKYIPRGISGQTSYHYMVRIRPDVIDLHPEYVVLGAPTNDIAENAYPYDENVTMENFSLLVTMLKANGIKVIMTSALPADRFPWNPEIKNVAEKIISLNKRLKALARKEHCYWVDYYPSLVTETGGAFRPELTGDGVHPSRPGYDIMESVIQKFLTKILK